ncbi:hypothetical protein AAVH_14521 [Aphelenchoides avenae]|nr:hypothetical protein AAVH_14521 [Aphelenchus avenae]
MADGAGHGADLGDHQAQQAGQQAHAAAPAPQASEHLTTYRNNPAVIIGGFTYVHRRTANNVTYWRCVKSNEGCKASGKSAEGSVDVTQTGAAAIVDELMLGVEDEVAVAVDRNNLLRVANRAKRLDGSKQLNRPLAEIVFPDVFTKTATGLRFLLYDSRLHEPGESVIFIFASAQGLEQLRLRDHWSADGTFWCTPRLFDSLYTVHANIGSSSVPGAYMLLQNRTEATYTRALRALVRYGNLQGVAPSTFMHDFELAAILAIKAVFPDSMIRLCLFHFAQAIWRKIQELGLSVLYKTVKKARILLRCFGALATVPVEDVPDACEAIVTELNVMLDETAEIPIEYNGALARFFEYFKKTYVLRENAAGNLTEPRFRPTMWNCFQAILQELHRTNNAVEGWHMEFNNTFTTAHPALDKFITQLQNDEDKNRQRLVRHTALPGNPLRRRRVPAYMASDKHILAIARKYRTDYSPAGEVLRYLKCMQNHLVQADFGEAAAEDDGAGPHPPAPADDDPDGGGGDDAEDDDIPLNESHPALDGSSDETRSKASLPNMLQRPTQTIAMLHLP